MMRRRITGNLITLSCLITLIGCEGSKYEESVEPPRSKFLTAFPKKFLNPEKALGETFKTISEGDTTIFTFQYSKIDRNSSLKVINKTDTLTYSPIFLNRHRELYFINYQEGETWKIVAFSPGDSTVSGLNPNDIFAQLYDIDKAIVQPEFKKLIEKETIDEIQINGEKKDLYKLFSRIVDSTDHVLKLVRPLKNTVDPDLPLTIADSSTEEKVQIKIKVYPNPATDKVTVANISKGWIVALKDLNGDAVQVKVSEREEVVFDVSKVKAGDYYLYAFDPATKKKETVQLVIQH